MFEEYKAEYRINKASIDTKALWNTMLAVTFITVLVLL